MIILPTINGNGTSRAELFDNYAAAVVAIDFALDAIRHTAPHGRDYYLQEPGALRQAHDEHTARLAALEKISEELQALAEHAS